MNIATLNDKDFVIFLSKINRIYLPLNKNNIVLNEIYNRLIKKYNEITPDTHLSYLIYQLAIYIRRILLNEGDESNSSVTEDVLSKISSLLGDKSKMRKGDQLLLISSLVSEDEEGNFVFNKDGRLKDKIFGNNNLKDSILRLFQHFSKDYDYRTMYNREDSSLISFILFNNIVGEINSNNELNKRIRLEVKESLSRFPDSFKASILESFVNFSYIENNRLPVLVSMRMAFVKYIDPIEFLEIVGSDIGNLLSNNPEQRAILEKYQKLNDKEKNLLQGKITELRGLKSKRS